MSNQLSKSNIGTNTESRVILYRSRLNELIDIIRFAGYDARAFAADNQSRFPALASERQGEIIKAIESALRIYSSAIDSGIDAKDNLQMSWWAVRELGYRPLSDAFSRLDETNVVEVYDASHKQVFRTLNFFPCVSYSLDEISTYEWWELYHRSEALTQGMMKAVTELMANPPATLTKPFEDHWL